jgi:membrane protein
MKTTVIKTGHLLKNTFNEFIEDRGIKLSAALSYYTVFSLPPLLIIIISLSGVFFGAEAVRGEIFNQIRGFVGDVAALQIQDAIKNVKLSGNSNFATIVSLVVLLVGASGVFTEIQDSINYIWGIEAKPKKGFIKFLKNRLMSFSMLASVSFLLLVGLVVNSVLDVLNQRFIIWFPKEAFYFIYVLNTLIVFVIITVLFTVIFKTLPDGKVVLRDCIVGASFTAVLFMVGKFAISAYLGSAVIASVYGPAGSVVLILIWVYYSAIILYFGAEFTKVYALNHGKKIIPNEYSVRIEKFLVVDEKELTKDGTEREKK